MECVAGGDWCAARSSSSTPKASSATATCRLAGLSFETRRRSRSGARRRRLMARLRRRHSPSPPATGSRFAARSRGRGRRSSSATGSPRRGATSYTAPAPWRAPGIASSPTTRAATASPTRPPPAGVMDTRSWSAIWSRSSRHGGGGGRFVLAGHSMGAHTAVAYALRQPERLAGLVVDRAGLRRRDPRRGP